MLLHNAPRLTESNLRHPRSFIDLHGPFTCDRHK